MMREEEEEETFNGVNDDTNNIYRFTDSDNNRIGDGNCNLTQISQVWGTWEELVLICAVKRHGDSDWDSVAKEVASRSSLNASAPNCRLKYQDLKRRFQISDDGGDDDGEGNSEAAAEDEVGENREILLLEQLRSLRVAELRREVQRCDDSILSLQLKVKKLEEERYGNDGDNKPDLEDDSKAGQSPINETEPARLNRETTESDRDNRSMSESNSTASVDKIVDHELLYGEKMVQACENSRNPDPDAVHKAAAAEEGEGTVSKGSEMCHSGGLGESGTSTGHRKRKRQIYRSGENSNIRGGSGGNIKSAGNKSQPLIEIIKLIRSHQLGSVFETRLRSQETKAYKSLIRQHLDIKTIEKKMEKGSYVSSSLSFYRDIKLLFTNAIVFFPSSSSESMAAHELRTLVSNEITKQTGKSGHNVINSEADSSVPRQKPAAPLVVCKKKSSGLKKTSPSSSFKQKDEKKSQEVSEEKIICVRSSRRTNKGINVAAKDTKSGRAKSNNIKKQADSRTELSNDDDDDDVKEESSKTEKKKKKKKKSVADFLKRIKKNSPKKEQQKKSDENVKKQVKQRELRSNSRRKKKIEVENKSSSKPKKPKKEAEEVNVATRKRGRESEKDNKQPKKRSRR